MSEAKTTLTVYDLAVDVLLYLVTVQRRVEDGEQLSYADTRAELLSLLSEQEQRSHAEPGLWEGWKKARTPLVYLIDEVFIYMDWPHAGAWSDENFEVQLLGHSEALGGDYFYNECEQALAELANAERANRPDLRTWVDIVTVYYVALQVGFKGRYRNSLDEWRKTKAEIFAKLPSYATTRTAELFPDTDDFTVVLDPNYEPVMRLLYVGIGVCVLMAIYLASTYGTWSQMTSELKTQADSVAVPTSQPSS